MLKASFEVVHPANGQSFLVRKFDELAFEAPYHYHAEFELTYIMRGKGKRYVGTHMEDFSDGDLVLLGSNLPHCWKLEGNRNGSGAKALVIQFTDQFLGAGFFDTIELGPVKKMLSESRYGIRFQLGDTDTIGKKLRAVYKGKDNFNVLIRFIQALYQLACSSYQTLDQQQMTARRTPVEQERMSPVLGYIVEHFKEKVSLNRAAEIAHMSPNAFCKYFKKNTRKTFMQMVTEYRLNHARQQLIQTDKPISDISFESGFGDVSHFYKTFKSHTRLSPLNYRKKFFQGVG